MSAMTNLDSATAIRRMQRAEEREAALIDGRDALRKKVRDTLQERNEARAEIERLRAELARVQGLEQYVQEDKR